MYWALGVPLAQQKHTADKQTLAFINEINQVRIALQSSNSVNVQLLLEKLLAQWFALLSYKQRQVKSVQNPVICLLILTVT